MAVNHLSYHHRVDVELLEILATPGGDAPLELLGNELAAADGRRYPIRGGIPQLLPGGRQPWRAFYDRAAWAYDAMLALGALLGLGSEERIRARLLPNLAAAGDLVLDVGCGTGASRPYLPAGIRYIGIDLSYNMLRRAQRKCQRLQLPAAWVQGDLCALPARGASADALLAMGVLQHAAQPAAALAELARAAKPGAQLWLIDEVRSLRQLGRLLPPPAPADVGALADWLAAQAEWDVLEELQIDEYFCLCLLRR